MRTSRSQWAFRQSRLVAEEVTRILDERGCFDHGRSVVIASPAGEDHQQRTQALAAPCDDVIGNLVHKRYGALEPGADDLIDGFQVRLDERAYLFEGHRFSSQARFRRPSLWRPRILADTGFAENGVDATAGA